MFNPTLVALVPPHPKADKDCEECGGIGFNVSLVDEPQMLFCIHACSECEVYYNDAAAAMIADEYVGCDLAYPYALKPAAVEKLGLELPVAVQPFEHKLKELIHDTIAPMLASEAMRLYDKLTKDEREALDPGTFLLPKAVLCALVAEGIFWRQIGAEAIVKTVKKLRRINHR